MEQILRKDDLPWYTFHHDSRKRMFWDLSIILLALWNCIYIPIDVAFKPESGPALWWSDRVIDTLFVVDIVINFMTTYVNPKTSTVVKQPVRIVKNYLFRGRFIIDLLASIPFDLILPKSEKIDNEMEAELNGGGSGSGAQEGNYEAVFGLLKMIRLLRLGRIITFMKFK